MKSFTAQDIEDLLSNRFCAPAWAFIPQVRNGTGFLNSARTADALAMSLWPSRGLHLNGFEIKINRGDWLSELKNPAKAEAIAQFCDFFWVVSPKDIIKLEEIPQNWGWLVPFGKSVKAMKPPIQMKSEVIDKLFLAAILRRAQETIAPAAKIEAARKKGKAEGEKEADRAFKYSKERHAELKQRIFDFQKKSGVNIDSWQLGDIAKAVKMIVNGQHLRAKEDLKSLHTQALQIADKIAEELKENVSQ